MDEDHPSPGLPTTGHHVFVDPFGSDDNVVIGGPSGHHLAAVLRVRVGEPVSLADDTGAVFQAHVVQTQRDEVTVEVAGRFDVPAAPVALSLVQALPKGRKMDEVVQRATEIGVDVLTPVVTARCVKLPVGKDDKLLARWRAVALAAAQQSRRARLPRIDDIVAWPQPDAVGVIAWEMASTPIVTGTRQLLADPARRDHLANHGLTIAIGPEGGFASDEVEAAGDLVPVSLGPTILRTETAGIVALVLVASVTR